MITCFTTSRNGIKQRKNSWQDGVLGTNCPIPPNSNYTYKFQTKDQIGSYTYFPSTLLHKAAGGFGGINVYERPKIPIPFPNPDGDFTLLIGDWYKTNHKVSRIFFFFAYTQYSLNTSILYRNGILYVHLFEKWLNELYVLVQKYTFPVNKVSYIHF